MTVTRSVGTGEIEAAAALVRRMQKRPTNPRTMGADAAYCNEGFVGDMRVLGVSEHPAQHKTRTDMGG